MRTVINTRCDVVEQTYIGCGHWTVQRFDIAGQPGYLWNIKYEIAADVLASIEARQLDPWCRRKDLCLLICKRR